MENIEELLKEAKRKYPVGTKFESAYNNSIREVTEGVIYNNRYDILIDRNYVYYNNKWAEIISSPIEVYSVW